MKLPILLAYILVLCRAEKQIKILIQIIRHGSRNYIHEIDNIKVDKSKQAFLTNTGMRSSYQLGKFVRNSYKQFFDRLPLVDGINARASSTERTLMTGVSFLYGLFEDLPIKSLDAHDEFSIRPPIKGFSLNYNSLGDIPLPNNFLPVPISTYYKNNLFLNGLHNCPKTGEFIARFVDFYSNRIIKDLKPTIDYFDTIGFTAKATFNKFEMDFKNLWYLCDTLFTTIWTQTKAKQINRDMITHCSYILALSQFIPYQSETLAREMHLPRYMLFQEILEKHRDSDIPVYVPVFAHDDTVTTMLSVSKRNNFDCILSAYKRNFINPNAGVEDPDCITTVPYNANLTFEVFSNPSSPELYIEGLYNGKRYNICNIEGDCPLDYFMSLFRSKIVHRDYNDVCGVEVFERHTVTSFLLKSIAIVLSTLVLMATIIYLYNIRTARQMKDVAKEIEIKNAVPNLTVF